MQKESVTVRRPLAAAVARRLEEGSFRTSRNPLFLAAERAWIHFVALERPILVPKNVHVITVGGSTLGGSGKTPIAMTIARQISSLGFRTALVSHAFGSRAKGPTWVSENSDARACGDEAVMCARELAPFGVRVVSAKRRQTAVDFACSWATALVIDGALQLAPRKSNLAVLAVSADAPWGSLACPPRGDLRAPREVLLSVADVVAENTWELVSATSTCGRATYTLSELRSLRIGLITNVARPQRVVGMLERAAVSITAHIELPDHGSLDETRFRHFKLSADLWISPRKAVFLRDLKSVQCAWMNADFTPSIELSKAVALSVRRSKSEAVSCLDETPYGPIL